MSDCTLQADLLTALLEGPFESPVWSTFLDRLRLATCADYVVMNFRPPGRPFDEMLHLMSGDSPAKVGQTFLEHFQPTEPPLLSETLHEGRPYSLKDLLASDDPRHVGFNRDFLLPNGLTGIRQMRVQEATGINVWLTLVRRGKDFSARDSAILSSTAPVLRGVLRQYVALERERFAASLTAEAVRRLRFGWLSLDRHGHVLDCDDQGALVLSNSGVLSRNAAGRLVATPARLDRTVTQALNALAEKPQARPRAITLSRDPWLDMLLVPARRTSLSAKAAPAVIAYVHGDSWHSTDRCEQLAELFTLSPSEARLALALCRGMTIAEAATEFRLTIDTARSYSKAIYAKTGARGLPDLVRIVMRSVLAIMPET